MESAASPQVVRRLVGNGVGIFSARLTRDGEALARDGHPYFAMNRLVERNRAGGERALFEIQFADGVWMPVCEDDLVAGTIGSIE